MQYITKKEEFEQLIKDNNNVVIDFFATWCNPCKMLSPVVEEVASDVTNVIFVKVDVDKAHELSEMFGIMSIPTIVYIKNQKMALREMGFKSKSAIMQNIKTIYE